MSGRLSAPGDIVAFPSLPGLGEGFGLAAFEAMAAARPAVATATDSLPEIVLDGQTGYLVTPGSVEGMADILVKLARDEELRRILGTRGRERAGVVFSFEAMLNEPSRSTRKCFDTLLGRALRTPRGTSCQETGSRLLTLSRVFRIITRLNVGGPARQAIFLSRVLERRGFGTELASGSVGPGEGELVPTDGVHTKIPEMQRSLSPTKDLRAARAVARLVRARKPDIVHTHMAKAGALGRLAAHRAGVPVVVHTFHGHVLEGYFGRSVTQAFLAAERRLAHWSDALVAVSPAVRDQLLALGIGEPNRWRVIPVGLELDELLAPLPSSEESRRRLGLPQEGPIVGIVGRLVPIKDHETFLRAAARIAARRPGVTFVAAGDGELRTALEIKAREMIGDRIRFLGWVTDLPALYAAMDVVVLTSRNEGTPISLVEAGAAARPTVSTQVGGVDDVVVDEVTGMLTPAGDDEAIASAVSRLLDDPARARAMGEAARERIPARYSADRLADDLSDLYRDLLDHAKHRSSPLRGLRGTPE